MHVRSVFVSLSIFLLVFMMSFGGVLGAALMTHGGEMGDCPFLGMTGYCAMDASEHLAGWQQLFATTLEPLNPLALLTLLSFAVLAYVFFETLTPKRKERVVYERWRSRELFDPLRLALARGLIHPKLYS